MYEHKPVLLDECIDNLQINPKGYYLDGTLGGAGHSLAIVKHLTTGKLVGVDQDIAAINNAPGVFGKWMDKVLLVHDNFSNSQAIASQLKLPPLDGVLLDLGVSSHQLDTASRGFSYMQNARLDMRMNQATTLSAFDVVNKYPASDLNRIFKAYGEEKWSHRIADFIVKARQQKDIDTTQELVDIIKNAIPANARRGGPHPATRVFQAIRMEVNQELPILEEAITDLVDILKPGGRLCVISFHSLEDRLVKQTIKEMEDPCHCIKELPCVCGKKQIVKRISKKPIIPSAGELEENPRARSAKLRVAEKIGN